VKSVVSDGCCLILASHSPVCSDQEWNEVLAYQVLAMCSTRFCIVVLVRLVHSSLLYCAGEETPPHQSHSHLHSFYMYCTCVQVSFKVMGCCCEWALTAGAHVFMSLLQQGRTTGSQQGWVKVTGGQPRRRLTSMCMQRSCLIPTSGWFPETGSRAHVSAINAGSSDADSNSRQAADELLWVSRVREQLVCACICICGKHAR